jgi:hypothetical protein
MISYIPHAIALEPFEKGQISGAGDAKDAEGEIVERFG